MPDHYISRADLDLYKFNLSENFIHQYKNQQPDWGPIGYITYKRTYARPILEEDRSEEWWETIKRVVEGTYTIQKHHCKTFGLPWNGNKAQKSAQEMYRLIWDFKFLPSAKLTLRQGFVSVGLLVCQNNSPTSKSSNLNSSKS